MAKGDTFGDLFPYGRCIFCREECLNEAFMHQSCADAFEQVREMVWTLIKAQVRKQKREKDDSKEA